MYDFPFIAHYNCLLVWHITVALCALTYHSSFSMLYVVFNSMKISLNTVALV